MGPDPYFPAQVGGTGPEFMLHDAEALLDLPSPLIDVYNSFRLIFQVGADRVEPVISSLCGDLFFVQGIISFFRDLTVGGAFLFFDEAFRIRGMVLIKGGRITDLPFCPFHLSLPEGPEVIPVFQGIGHDHPLFQTVFFEPALLVKNSIPVELLIQVADTALFPGRIPAAVPSVRVQAPFPLELFKLLNGLDRNECPAIPAVQDPVVQGREAGIGADDEFG